jgi:lysophospholipase L1-like esterase
MASRSSFRITSAAMNRLRRASFVAVLTAALSCCLVPRTAALAGDDHSNRSTANWSGTWSASPQAGFFASDFNHRSVRNIVHASIGGRRLRLRLSNAFGTTPLVIDAAHVAIRSAGASIVAGTDRLVSFSGTSTVTIPPGALIVSDAVTLAVPALSDIAVSIFLNGNQGPATSHNIRGVSYVAEGDATGNEDGAPYTGTIQSWLFLAGVEVLGATHRSAIVALGDSITDGAGSTPGSNNRWPDELARRLAAQHRRLGVLNQGIAGNRLLKDGFGQNALARFDRDVLAQTGAKFVIVLEGINDIGTSSAGPDVTAPDIIAALRQLAVRAHSRRLKIFGATLTPFEGTLIPGYFTPEGEMKRQAVNEFIRTTRMFDGVIDFDEAVRDPEHPTRLLPAYDSGDHLHPNDAGYLAMGQAVDLSLFAGRAAHGQHQR